MMLRFISAACLLFLLNSCATLYLKRRAGKDENLTPAMLQGAYRLPADTNAARQNALCYFAGYDSLNRNLQFYITPEGGRKVRIQQPGIRPGDTLNILLKGRYKKGHFVTRRKWSASMPLGPLLWAPEASRLAIGISRQQQLVLLYASAGTLLVTAMPVNAAAVYEETYCIKTQ